jgi:hypothetical protein
LYRPLIGIPMLAVAAMMAAATYKIRKDKGGPVQGRVNAPAGGPKPVMQMAQPQMQMAQPQMQYAQPGQMQYAQPMQMAQPGQMQYAQPMQMAQPGQMQYAQPMR